MHLYISPVRSDKSTRKTCAASERGRIMAPFSRATGRWCPLLRLQAEFPKEAFHEPERPQLPVPSCSSQGRMRGAASPRWPVSCQPGSLQNCHHIPGCRGDVSSDPVPSIPSHVLGMACLGAPPCTGPAPSLLGRSGGHAAPSATGLRVAPCATHGCRGVRRRTCW